LGERGRYRILEDAHWDSELELCPTVLASVSFVSGFQEDRATINVRGGWRLWREDCVARGDLLILTVPGAESLCFSERGAGRVRSSTPSGKNGASRSDSFIKSGRTLFSSGGQLLCTFERHERTERASMYKATSRASVPRCPHCGGQKLFRSRRRGLKDWFLHSVLFQSAYRCAACDERFFRFRDLHHHHKDQPHHNQV
jgi:DNA-directed RNA polymerase subunit RPC12/RpoP